MAQYQDSRWIQFKFEWKKYIVKKIVGIIIVLLIAAVIVAIGIVLSEKKHIGDSGKGTYTDFNQSEFKSNYGFWNDHVYWIGSVPCEHCHGMRSLNEDRYTKDPEFK